MANSELSAWDGWSTSQLKIVLLGGRNSGKNSLGNLILGKEEFVSKERTSCSRRVGLVAGRWITVVDAPGWWCDFSAQETSNLIKREIISSVSLCSPGPDVFLITVKASSGFSERRRRAVEEHVSLLGDNVWSRSVVVFISSDGFQHSNTEEFVERGGRALCWLTEKCGQRCHGVVLNHDAEVAQLLVKIEKLVRENGSREFEMQENILQAAAEEKRRAEERAQMRFIRMRHHRSVVRERLRPVTNIRIVLLGAKGSGKSSTLNTILGRGGVQRLHRTARCCVGEAVVFGRQVTVVDTPGWWMNYFCDETSLFDRREMVLSLSLCPPGPHVFLLVIRLDRAFSETYRRAVQEHLELISEHIWSCVILLFSFGDWLSGTTTELYIESEGEALRWLVGKCCNRYHVLNNNTKGDGFQVRELIGKIEEMMSGCTGGWHYEIERKELEELEKKVKTEAERAKGRLMRKETQRQKAWSNFEKLSSLQDLKMILVGSRKAGKSSCGNTILSRESFDTDTRTTSCSESQGKVSSRTVSVLDTPGGWALASELLTTPSAILLVVNVSSSFTELHREAMDKQLEAGGVQLWSRALVLFSHGDWLGDTNIEQRIESEGEPLQRLVEQCGNRYHVLDNKKWGDGAQVEELTELVEGMLVGQVAVRHRGDQVWKRVYSAEQQSGARRDEKDGEKRMSSRRQPPPDLVESASSVSHPSPTRSEDSEEARPVGSLTRRTCRQTGFPFLDRNSLMSFLGSALKQELRWTTVDLPVRLPYSQLRRNNDNHTVSPRRQTVLLVSCQSQPSVSSEEDGFSLRSLCRPALRERTLQRVSEPEGLQTLVDQWGHSSLDELEAFIDSYFERVWEQTMGPFQPSEVDRSATEEEDALIGEAGGEQVLLSIDRKLSKLELLEEISSHLVELRQNQERSWRAIRELRDNSEKD